MSEEVKASAVEEAKGLLYFWLWPGDLPSSFPTKPIFVAERGQIIFCNAINI